MRERACQISPSGPAHPRAYPLAFWRRGQYPWVQVARLADGRPAEQWDRDL